MTAAVLSSVTPDNLHEVVATVLDGEHSQRAAGRVARAAGGPGQRRSRTTARSAVALAKIGKAELGQVRRLATDGVGRVARRAGSARRCLGEVRRVERAGQDVRLRPRAPWPTSKRPKKSGCGPCGCWAAASAAARGRHRLAGRAAGAAIERRVCRPAAVEALAGIDSDAGADGPVGRLEEPRARRCDREILDVLAEPRPLDRRRCSTAVEKQASARRRHRRHAPAAAAAQSTTTRSRSWPPSCCPARSNRTGSRCSSSMRAVLTMTGDAQAGAAVFAKRCAVCHRLARRGARSGAEPGFAHRLLAAGLAHRDARSQSGRRSQVSRLPGRDHQRTDATPACWPTKPATASRCWARKASSRRSCAPSWKCCKRPASR